jgi:hypothetical protein
VDRETGSWEATSIPETSLSTNRASKAYGATLTRSAGPFELRRWGALLSALATVGFIANAATAVLRGRRGGRRSSRA